MAEAAGRPHDEEVLGTDCTPIEADSEASASGWDCTITYQAYGGFEPNRYALPELDSEYEVTFGDGECWTAISEEGKTIDSFTPEQQRELEDGFASERLEGCL